MYCKHCGRQISDNSKFCNNCGTAIQNDFRQNISQGYYGENIENSNIKKTSYKNKPFKYKVIITVIVIALVGLIGTGVAHFILNSWNSPDSMVSNFFKTCEKKDVSKMMDICEHTTKHVFKDKEITEEDARQEVEDWYDKLGMDSDYSYEIISEESLSGEDLLEYQLEAKYLTRPLEKSQPEVTEGKKIKIDFNSNSSHCSVNTIKITCVKVDGTWLFDEIETN